MDGVIIFADNNVFETGSFENKLFSKLQADKTLSVLPIDTIENLEKVLKAMSTFKALILDWNFERGLIDDEQEGVRLPDTNPKNLLENIDLYSLVYIYSQAEIPQEDKTFLTQKFNEKIRFRSKGSIDAIVDEYTSIKGDIDTFERDHAHMEVPFIWSHTINQSAQTIFYELESANPNWIKEIRDSARSDGGDSTSEIIEIFHNVLNESLIQNKSLRKALDKYDYAGQAINEENTAKLYRRIFYSKLTEDAPIMTGDIFRFEDNKYGILITPECEVNKRKDLYLEFLTFLQDDMNKYLCANNNYKRNEDDYGTFNDKKKDKILKIFNNDDFSYHIIPSFPFSDNVYNESAIINFKTSFAVLKKTEYEGKRLGYKLNAPYIHQLRQRYIAHFGRYGVPVIPNSLREYNIK